MCFDIGNMTVPGDKRSVALGTCQLGLAQSLFLVFFFANNGWSDRNRERH